MIVVRCNACGVWIGNETELAANERCPNCGASHGLMYVDHSCVFDQPELKALWGLFGDIPIDDADQILEDFLGFRAGTDRFEVWHWFDERYAGGVVKTWSI